MALLDDGKVSGVFTMQEALIGAAKALVVRVNELAETSMGACTDKKPVEVSCDACGYICYIICSQSRSGLF